MYRSIFVLFLCFMITSCDTGTRTRRSKGSFSGSKQNPLTDGNNFIDINGTNTGSGTNSGTTGTNGITSGFENCNLDSFYYSGSLKVSTCQSSTEETKFKVKFWLASNNSDFGDQTCLIPTYTDSNENSLYLGNPSCTSHSAGQILEDYLQKNRPGYSSYPINSLMVMKQRDVGHYLACMDTAPYVTQVNSGCAGLPSNLTVSYLGQYFPQCLCYYFSTNKTYLQFRTR